jgi:SpoIID/LytB domain protein
MSQCGADALASHGYDFEEILKFYYTGVTVEEIRY